MTEDEVRKQNLQRLEWQLEFEEIRMRTMARDEITFALREFVDRFIENMEAISEQEAAKSFWHKLKNRIFGRQIIYITKESMKETAEMVIVGIGKGLKP